MKKLFTVLLSILILVCVSSCGKQDENKEFLIHQRDSIQFEIELYEDMMTSIREDMDVEITPENADEIMTLCDLYKDFKNKVETDKEKIFQLNLVIYK